MESLSNQKEESTNNTLDLSIQLENLNLNNISENLRKQLVIFILGTTGVGKSKLSLDLALKLGGEIVNADSMQIYDGNDGIMTAKPTQEELQKVPHHLYGVVNWLTYDFNVNKYRELALEAIRDIQSRGKVPIIVGGTNYYIESLVYEQSQIIEEFKYDKDQFEQTFEHEKSIRDEKFHEILEDLKVLIPLDKKQAIEDKYDSDLLHELLTLVDKKLSDLLHSKDKQSDIQMQSKGRQLRFLPIFIQMSADKDILESRIVKRINQMIDEMNGIEEIYTLFSTFEQCQGISEEMDPSYFEKGIFQSIGYKEFYPLYRYLLYRYAEDGLLYNEILKNPSKQDREEIQKGKDQLKVKTVNYAQYQLKWLNKRINQDFGNKNDSNDNLLLVINLNDPKQYEEIALNKALEFIDIQVKRFSQFSEEFVQEFKQSYCNESSMNKKERLLNWKKVYCEKCNQELNGQKQWQEHIQTRKHKNRNKDKKLDSNNEKQSQKKKPKNNQEEIIFQGFDDEIIE
eukprot:403335685